MVRQLTIFSLTLNLFFTFSLNAQEDVLKTILEADDLAAFQELDKTGFEQIELFQHSLNRGAVQVAEYLIDQGIDVNMNFEGGATSLITAVNSNQPEIVKLLLSRKADPNQQEQAGLQGTPLMYAASRNDLTIPKLLVAAGAAINQLDVNADPALNWAAYYGNVKTMKWLIAQGADLNIRSKHGMAVDVGLRLWHADSVMEVFRHTAMNQPLSKSESRLYQAVQSNDLKAAAKLLKDQSLVNTKDGLGTPMLQLAAQQGNSDMVKLLLNSGADPNQMNRVGMAPLAFAARFGHTKCVELLLEAGGDPNTTGEQYRLTAMMGAAVRGDLGIAQRLLRAGADLSIVDQVNQGNALIWSLFYRKQDLALWMLENGADYQSKVLAGTQTIYSLAKLMGAARVVDWIDRNKDAENPLTGSWRVQEIHYIQADTIIKVEKVHGGRVTFSENNYHLLYNPWINPRKPFEKLAKPTKEEMIYGFQTLVFNSGTYVYTDSTVVTTADIAKVPGFEGGIQYYNYRLKGEELELTMYDETYPDGNKPEWYQKLKVLFKLVREKAGSPE
ncbi:MAG: hypothetical protein Roseis2KO_10780 [Roseivirga sp.]